MTTEVTGLGEMLCGSQGSNYVPSGGSVTFTCPASTYVNKVYIRRSLDKDQHLVTICEVEVEGEFYSQSFNNIGNYNQFSNTPW